MALSITPPTPATPQGSSNARAFLRRAAIFVLVGAGIYAALYAASEQLVYRYAHRNRFYAVRSSAPALYDYVVLGASHAAVLDYRDMNARLERLTGARIMNLSIVGAGVAVNRLLLEYFLTRHRTRAVLYVADSFAFYSSEWNEARLRDRRLFGRAPFDPVLAALLLRNPASRSTAVDYIFGFSKINNPDRFAPDTPPEEGSRFERTYRPIRQIDQQRVAYLYPSRIDPAVFQRYLGEYEALIRSAKARGIDVIVVKPPIPDRVYSMLPDETDFDAALEIALDRHDAKFHDFSHTGNEERFFQDTDHLNRQGVLQFFDALSPVLKRPS